MTEEWTWWREDGNQQRSGRYVKNPIQPREILGDI